MDLSKSFIKDVGPMIDTIKDQIKVSKASSSSINFALETQEQIRLLLKKSLDKIEKSKNETSIKEFVNFWRCFLLLSENFQSTLQAIIPGFEECCAAYIKVLIEHQKDHSKFFESLPKSRKSKGIEDVKDPIDRFYLRKFDVQISSLKKLSETGDKLPANSKQLDASCGDFEKELQCPVCQDLFIKANVLKCSHSFCEYCITTWLKTKATCPSCRSSASDPISCLVLDSIIERFLLQSSKEIRKKYEQRVTEREAAKIKAEEISNALKNGHRYPTRFRLRRSLDPQSSLSPTINSITNRISIQLRYMPSRTPRRMMTVSTPRRSGPAPRLFTPPPSNAPPTGESASNSSDFYFMDTESNDSFGSSSSLGSGSSFNEPHLFFIRSDGRGVCGYCGSRGHATQECTRR